MVPFLTSLVLCVLLAPLALSMPPSAGSSPAANTPRSRNSTFEAYFQRAMYRKRPIYGVTFWPDIFNSYQEATVVSDKNPGCVLGIAYGRWAFMRNGTVHAFATEEYSEAITQTFRAGRSLADAAGQSPMPDLATRDHPFSWGDWPRKHHPPCYGGPCDNDDDDCAMYNCAECVGMEGEIGSCIGDRD